MIYYNTLEKESKLKIKESLLKNDKENIIYKKVNKIFKLSIAGFLFSIGAFIFDFIYKTGILNYTLDGLLFIFSITFIYKSSKMKINELNKYALKSEKKS